MSQILVRNWMFSGSGDVMVSFKVDPIDPCCHGNHIFPCSHKSSASVRQRSATITLGFATLSSILFNSLTYVLFPLT